MEELILKDLSYYSPQNYSEIGNWGVQSQKLPGFRNYF